MKLSLAQEHLLRSAAWSKSDDGPWRLQVSSGHRGHARTAQALERLGLLDKIRTVGPRSKPFMIWYADLSGEGVRVLAKLEGAVRPTPTWSRFGSLS